MFKDRLLFLYDNPFYWHHYTSMLKIKHNPCCHYTLSNSNLLIFFTNLNCDVLYISNIITDCPINKEYYKEIQWKMLQLDCTSGLLFCRRLRWSTYIIHSYNGQNVQKWHLPNKKKQWPNNDPILSVKLTQQ